MISHDISPAFPQCQESVGFLSPMSAQEEQAGGAEILLASLTGAKRVSLLEAGQDLICFFFCRRLKRVQYICP